MADSEDVLALDDEAFPAENLVRQRAARGEIEAGIAVADVYLIEQDGLAVAYLHVNRQLPGLVYLSGFAVRSQLQGQGVGSTILDLFLPILQDLARGVPLVTVTSPRNHAMLGLLLSRGFAGRWVLRDFFGPGKDRLGCQLSLAARNRSPIVETSVPAHRHETVYSLMEDKDLIVRSLVRTREGSLFGLSAARHDDFFPYDFPPEAREAIAARHRTHDVNR